MARPLVPRPARTLQRPGRGHTGTSDPCRDWRLTRSVACAPRRLKLHKLPKATSDYSAAHTASLVEKYIGRFQLPFSTKSHGRSSRGTYPPSRDDEFKIMLANEQWKNAIETEGGHSTPLTSASLPSLGSRSGRGTDSCTPPPRLLERSVLYHDRDRNPAPRVQGHVSRPLRAVQLSLCGQC